MKNCYIFTAKAQAVHPGQIVDALKSAGFTKTETLTTTGQFGGFSCELNYLPDRVPIFVEVSEDFAEGSDIATSAQEMADDMVQDVAVRETIRRMVNVRAIENADKLAFSTTVKFIQEEMNGVYSTRTKPVK